MHPAGDKRLVAYVVAKGNIALSARTLRESLAERLPDYMIPSTFVQVEQLPVSASGNWTAPHCRRTPLGNTLHEDAYEAPQTEIQERVALIVANLLGVERIGIDDNFFSMGGHSLLGAQMIARISDTFGVELSLLSVFDDPTVRGMSAEIERLFLAKLESMSEEEAQRLLAAQDGN